MLLLVLAFREDFEQEGILLPSELLDPVGVDLARHPNMLVRFRPVASVHDEEVVADDVRGLLNLPPIEGGDTLAVKP